MASGQHLWNPWRRAIDSGEGRDLSKALRLIARVGDEALSGMGSGSSKIYISVGSPRKGEQSAFELTDIDIMKAGAEVSIESNSQDPSDWLLKAQTFKLMREEGFTRRYLADKLFSYEFDQAAEVEGFEERAMDQALEHPQFAEIASVPILLKNWINEVQGDPELLEFAQSMLNGWMNGVTKRASLEVQVKEGELQIQQMQIEKMMMEMQMMQQGMAQGQPMSLPAGSPAADDSGAGPSPSGAPTAIGGGAPGQQGRPEEKSSAPTSSQNFQQQGAGSVPKMASGATPQGVTG
jgi:hypothetical protein